MINNVTLVGRLTRDPELRYTQNNKAVINFNLAVNRDAAKEGQQDADFISCVAWNKTAELISQYLHKGSLVGIVGSIQTRDYDNDQGQKVYVTEVLIRSVQFLDPKNAQNQAQSQTYSNPYNQSPYSQPVQQTQQQPAQSFQYGGQTYKDDGTLEISADDLPF